MKTVIVDERISEGFERALLLRGFGVLKLPRDRRLGDAVCSHPDTLLFYHGGEMITTAEYCDDTAYFFSDLREFCPEVKITFTADERSALYPFDCVMNALVIGNKIFAKIDTLSESIKDFARERGYKLCNTKQGYPACTVLAFGNYAITSDRGMARVLTDEGVEVTLIREGHILLDSCDYGFIGGASGVAGEKVYFFGDIESHPDGDLICDRIRRAGFTPISLSSEPLRDLGGMIFLENYGYDDADKRN